MSMRSLLFVPGNRPERFQKARESGADVYCIDLEDAVSPAEKEAARNAVLEHVTTAGSNCYVRINGLATRQGMEDLLSLASAEAAPAGIVVPMIASVFEIRQVSQLLAHAPSLKIMPMIETPEGLDNLPAILEEGRACIETIAFGFGDYAACIGSDMSWDALLGARSALLKAASRNGVACIDGPCFDIHNLDGLEDEAARVASLGFSGKLAIHPAQVAVINDVFAPSAAKINWAHDVIAAYEKAGGGVVSHAGMMIDQPIIDQARRLIASVKK